MGSATLQTLVLGPASAREHIQGRLAGGGSRDAILTGHHVVVKGLQQLLGAARMGAEHRGGLHAMLSCRVLGWQGPSMGRDVQHSAAHRVEGLPLAHIPWAQPHWLVGHKCPITTCCPWP